MKIDVSNSEVLRYLGNANQEVTKELLNDIERCKKIILEKSAPKYIFGIYALEKSGGSIRIENTELYLYGNDIKDLLKNSSSCILVAATVGALAEKTINYYGQVCLSDAVIMDAVLSAQVEALIDNLEEELLKKFSLTNRFSAGYGDLPLNCQRGFLKVLDAGKKIGLYLNEADMLIPKKSVTAIMGILEYKDKQTSENKPDKCKNCNLKDSCNFKRGGKTC